MTLTRRDIGKVALAAIPAARLLAKPNSKFGGVQVGVIAPYSFRGLPNTVDDLLKHIVQLGISAVELQAEPGEAFAGAPASGRGGPGGPGGAGGPRPGGPPGGPGGPGGGGRGGRPPMTPEQEAAQKARVEELRKWRLSVSMDKFKAVRKKYEDQGVAIDIVKFGLGPNMTDDEIDYCFQVAKALGCRSITCEPPVSETKRVGSFAEKHKMMVGYHGHSNVTGVEAFGRSGAWEQAFFYSRYNGANIDVGHFTAGNSFSPAAFIKQYHSRTTNLHLKDRKKDQGPNMPWGQGDTQIKEILQMMKTEKYDFMATIELEYPTPEGSDTMTELAKCVQYCKDALA